MLAEREIRIRLTTSSWLATHKELSEFQRLIRCHLGGEWRFYRIHDHLQNRWSGPPIRCFSGIRQLRGDNRAFVVPSQEQHSNPLDQRWQPNIEPVSTGIIRAISAAFTLAGTLWLRRLMGRQPFLRPNNLIYAQGCPFLRLFFEAKKQPEPWVEEVTSCKTDTGREC